MATEGTDRTDEILAAIAALSDRIGGLETSSLDRFRDLSAQVSLLDRKLNSVARKLLSGSELIALGISDPRSLSGSGSSGEAPTMPIAAKGSE